jgi:prophage regulatory protein
MQTILRLPSVKAETGLSCATIYRRIADGLWPKPVSLGARAVGWPAREVDAINAARIAGRCDQEIRCLVARLESARRSTAMKEIRAVEHTVAERPVIELHNSARALRAPEIT